VFGIVQEKMQAIFLKAMLGLHVVWTYFPKTTSIDPKKMFGCGGVTKKERDPKHLSEPSRNLTLTE